jgi:hypothetical protein
VTFVPTSIEGLPETYTDGQDVPLKISGDLTIREVTKPVDFDATFKLTGDMLTGNATSTILMRRIQQSISWASRRRTIVAHLVARP